MAKIRNFAFGAVVFGAFVSWGFCLWCFCLLGVLSLEFLSMGLLSVGLLNMELPSAPHGKVDRVSVVRNSATVAKNVLVALERFKEI